jgi:uncharacterized protein YndB with AHSA1/START domain
MRYQLELDIDLPRERVIEIFLDADNLQKWQPDMVSITHISGEPREAGAKNRQVHRMGKREIEMVETIMAPNPPYEYSATYEADGVWNLIENQFIDIDGQKTHWILDNEFKGTGIMKLMTFLLPWMFKKQTRTFMNLFKDFAEEIG